MEDSVEDSTPGTPLAPFGNKKGMWLQEKEKLARLVLERMEVLMTIKRTESPVELVKLGARDPIYTFIKNEPHKREKVEAKRFRLISGISLVDNIIERVLFSKQNKQELKLSNYMSFKPGMGLHDEGLKSLFSWFTKLQKLYKVCSTDVSAWDWSVFRELLMAGTEYRKQLAATSGAWATLVDNYYYGLRNKVFQLPSGELFMQTIEGIQASGSYCTSSDNSHCRHILATLVQLEGGIDEKDEPEGAQMGDDALERYFEGMERIYNDFGFRTKGVSLRPDGVFSFCSTLWEKNWKGQPEGWTKTLFRFLHQDRSDGNFSMWRDQLARDLRNHPNLNELLGRVDEVNYVQ